MVKSPENKNPVLRNIRACFLCEHDYMSVVSVKHQGLLNNFGGIPSRKTKVPIPNALLTLFTIYNNESLQ
jgi:hypothetical protein